MLDTGLFELVCYNILKAIFNGSTEPEMGDVPTLEHSLDTSSPFPSSERFEMIVPPRELGLQTDAYLSARSRGEHL